MKRVILLTVSLILSFSATLGQAEQADQVPSLKQAMQDFCAAANRGDGPYVDHHYVSEVTRFHDDGKLDVGWSPEKAAELSAMMRDGRLTFAFERCEIVDARVYGQVGITAGHMYGHMIYQGERIQGPWRFTYLWVRKDGQWKEAHHHVSLLEGQ